MASAAPSSEVPHRPPEGGEYVGRDEAQGRARLCSHWIAVHGDATQAPMNASLSKHPEYLRKLTTLVRVTNSLAAYWKWRDVVSLASARWTTLGDARRQFDRIAGEEAARIVDTFDILERAHALARFRDGIAVLEDAQNPFHFHSVAFALARLPPAEADAFANALLERAGRGEDRSPEKVEWIFELLRDSAADVRDTTPIALPLSRTAFETDALHGIARVLQKSPVEALDYLRRSIANETSSPLDAEDSAVDVNAALLLANAWEAAYPMATLPLVPVFLEALNATAPPVRASALMALLRLHRNWISLQYLSTRSSGLADADRRALGLHPVHPLVAHLGEMRLALRLLGEERAHAQDEGKRRPRTK